MVDAAGALAKERALMICGYAFAFGRLPSQTLSCWAHACGPFNRLQLTHFGKAKSMRTSGTVKFFNSAKGFGFIQPEGGSKDVFVHASALEAAGISYLNEGDRVSFVLEDDRKGRGKQAGQLQKE